ncbi:hypothetical protein HY498_03730, partial [Candidatus Woesearchaeota archaeon]|nr:hypothetical protein [Candidatus Woesearchaeota archaeon]
MKKNLIYTIILDLIFIVLLLLTLTSGRLILGGYLSQISQYGNLKDIGEINQENINEVESALIEVEPMVNKAMTSIYVINFVLILFYTLFIGTSWLLLRDKVKKFKDLLNFKRYYLLFGFVSLIYFYLMYKLIFKLVDMINIYDYFIGGGLGFNEGLKIIGIILVILILSFFYLLFSCKPENFKEEVLKLKKRFFLKLFLFILLFLFIFGFFINFFNLFINYLTGFFGLF